MYLDELNDRQKEAVLAISGPVCVLAGAGSGKTRVLTTRMYHLIRQGVPPGKILAVTFTNKAAREMRTRVQAMLGAEPEAPRPPSPLHTPRSNLRASSATLPFVATFHGLGRELLESYGSAIGVPKFFSIWDRDDSEKAVGAALKALDVNVKELSPRAVLGRISKAKGAGMTVSEFRAKNGRASFGARITCEAWTSYENALKKEKALDFDDLIALPVRLLDEREDVRAKAQERWDYIHIDEYQDTNELQERLARLLLNDRENLFVVGDGDQAIYGWRGAKMENILNFNKNYPDARTVILEHNYRSTKTIVDAANAVIEKNTNRKERRSVTNNPPGAKILVHVSANTEGEARFVARALRARAQEGRAPETMAVLFRTNFQSRGLEEALLRAGVPYRLLGTRYFERKEVKDALAWMRLALDPSREADKIRAVQAPSRGIGKITLGKLAAGKRAELRAGELAKVEAFERVVAELSRFAQTLVPSEFVRLVVEKSGMEKTLSAGSEEDLERLENVRELGTLASRHDATPGKEGIAAFLAEAALASDQDEMDRRTENAQQLVGGKVTLMTVHAAKGLEFDTVFVTGMEEGLFPHEGAGDEDRDEEEERRLFYVAMTRAKRELILTLAYVRKMYGTDYLSEPSSFLADLAPAHVAYDEDDAETTISI